MLLGHSGVQLVVFKCSSISVMLFDILRITRCHNTLFLSCLYLGFIISLIHDLFNSCVNSVMG